MTLTETMTIPAVRGATVRAVSARRWRVLDRRGRVIGHLRAESAADGTRFHAERFDFRGARMRDLGAFWSVQDAVDCLRHLR